MAGVAINLHHCMISSEWSVLLFRMPFNAFAIIIYHFKMLRTLKLGRLPTPLAAGVGKMTIHMANPSRVNAVKG